MQERSVETTQFKAGTQSAEDPFEFVLSDETVDRVGDVIRAKGWSLKEFRQNPIALLGHDHSQVIGVWKNVRVEGKRLLGRLELAKEGTSELIDTVRKLMEQRILKAVSVGFQIMEHTPRDEKAPWDGWDITKASLNECSVVAVPCNPAALSLAKAFSPACVDKLFVEPGSADDAALDVSGRPASEIKTPNLDQLRTRLKDMGIE